MSKQEKYELLANLLKHFQDKRWVLAKFLIDNDAINDAFIKKIQKENTTEIHQFDDLNQLNNYLNSLINNESETHQVDLESKLIELLQQEKYEEAAKIRDWMLKLKRRKS